jgi:hypothetical protein
MRSITRGRFAPGKPARHDVPGAHLCADRSGAARPAMPREQVRREVTLASGPVTRPSRDAPAGLAMIRAATCPALPPPCSWATMRLEEARPDVRDPSIAGSARDLGVSPALSVGFRWAIRSGRRRPRGPCAAIARVLWSAGAADHLACPNLSAARASDRGFQCRRSRRCSPGSTARAHGPARAAALVRLARQMDNERALGAARDGAATAQRNVEPFYAGAWASFSMADAEPADAVRKRLAQAPPRSRRIRSACLALGGGYEKPPRWRTAPMGFSRAREACRSFPDRLRSFDCAGRSCGPMMPCPSNIAATSP